MASLKKRGKTYYAQYYLHGKAQRLSLRTTSLQLAKDKLRKLESAMARHEELPFPTRTPLQDILKDYIKYLQTTHSKNSLKADLFYLRQVFGPLCPELETVRTTVTASQYLQANCLEDVTTGQAARFITSIVHARHLSPKSSNRYREVLHSLCSWAQRERNVRFPGTINPIARLPRQKEPAPDITFLTLPEIDEQLQAVAYSPVLRAAVAILIYAGLRREEALWLTTDDVLFLPGACHIRVRAKTIQGQNWQPKTKMNRHVPISPALRESLQDYAPAPSEGRWYLPSPEGKRWDSDNFSTCLRTTNNAAGLTWSSLDFRHTFGTQLAMKGVSLYKISTLMGNSPDICRRHYAALSSQDLTLEVAFG